MVVCDVVVVNYSTRKTRPEDFWWCSHTNDQNLAVLRGYALRPLSHYVTRPGTFGSEPRSLGVGRGGSRVTSERRGLRSSRSEATCGICAAVRGHMTLVRINYE
jgi:hypothetical protein